MRLISLLLLFSLKILYHYFIEIVYPWYIHLDPLRCSGFRYFSSIGFWVYTSFLVCLYSVTPEALRPIGPLLQWNHTPYPLMT